MKMIFIHKIFAYMQLQRILLFAAAILLLLVSGCSTPRNSSRNWQRRPASTGHNRCGCLLAPADHGVQIYEQQVYDVHA